MYGYGFEPWTAVVGGLMMLLFWGGAIALIVWAVRQFSGRAAGDDPGAILRRRLSAGEITQEQFEQARRALQS
jgi:uncharacterized membrane protein